MHEIIPQPRVRPLVGNVPDMDLLDSHPSCQLSFAEFLEMLPAMRVRQYSISSSPRRDPQRCTLTVAVVDASAWSGIGQFRGTCSSYLGRLAPGAEVAVAVRTPRTPFHPPAGARRPLRRRRLRLTFPGSGRRGAWVLALPPDLRGRHA
jgi:sulfite reductase alpha subunit-like flavoprotein